jgi:glycosyltransferase involved in cell wall biosynthesis
MRIAAVLEAEQAIGGGYVQAVNSIVQMAEVCRGKHDFCVFSASAENRRYLRELGLAVFSYRLNAWDLWLMGSAEHQLSRRLQARLGRTGGLESAMLAQGVDLVYFVSPTLRGLALQRLNYISTVWDNCHRDYPEFPEVRAYGQFLDREHLYRSTLAQSVCVVCDSPDLAHRLINTYGLDRRRLVAVPFSPGTFMAHDGAPSGHEVCKRYGLQPGYFFYPAQFWAHKNHVRIVEALRELRAGGLNARAVFSGGDLGNGEHVRAAAIAAGVVDQIRLLGFVPQGHMRGLYEAAGALVMPTYFGPTNLPPLEAWACRCPVIYSSTCAEQAGDAALIADPDSTSEWVAAMRQVSDPDVAEQLRSRGVSRLAAIDDERTVALQTLSRRLDAFAIRRQCWS